MKSCIIINGIAEDATMYETLINNRAFRYGDGLFETIRVCNGKPLFAEKHYERFMDGLKILKIESIEAHDFSFFKHNLNAVINSNNISNGGRIRYSINRTSGGYYKPLDNTGISIVEGQRIDDNSYQLNQQGLLIDLYDEVLKPYNILSPFKNAFALIHVLAGLKNCGVNYESILLNEQRNICEGVNSNIFILKNGTLHTPSLDQGCVRGIMRKVIMNDISRILNIEVIETTITRTFLKEADEIFLTNAIQGIKWVLGFEEKRYLNTFSKLVIQTINEFISDNFKKDFK